MGNKANKAPQQQAGESGVKKQTIQIKQKTVIKKKSADAGCCGGCFGGRSKSNAKDGQTRQKDKRSKTIHKAKKSQITVRTQANPNIDQKLFQGRQKQLIDIRLNRKQPYELLKDSDYFDSQLDDRNDLNKLAKTYETCEIANYQTPQIQKLQTVRVKTYLFDRNLTKVQA